MVSFFDFGKNHDFSISPALVQGGNDGKEVMSKAEGASLARVA